MSDLTPGSEEEFIRQLQEQLANESGNDISNSEEIKSDFDFATSEESEEGELLKEYEDDDLDNQNQKNKKKKGNNGKPGRTKKDSSSSNTKFSIFLNFIEVFGAPFIFFGGFFFLNHFIGGALVGIISAIVGSLLVGFYVRMLLNFRLSESYKSSEEILYEIGKGKLSFDVLNDEVLKKRLGKLAEPIDKVIKEMSDMVTKMELSVLDIVGNSDALAYFATSMANKTDQQEDSIIKIDNSTKNSMNLCKMSKIMLILHIQYLKTLF